MSETYNLNQLAMMTGMTTRTLRSDLSAGALCGEKIDGVWQFTSRQVQEYMSQPVVQQRQTIKQNAIAYDFLADTFKTANRLCVMLDLPVSEEESDAARDFFCDQACKSHDIQFHFTRLRGLSRVVLAGPEDESARIMASYYAG